MVKGKDKRKQQSNTANEAAIQANRVRLAAAGGDNNNSGVPSPNLEQSTTVRRNVAHAHSQFLSSASGVPRRPRRHHHGGGSANGGGWLLHTINKLLGTHHGTHSSRSSAAPSRFLGNLISGAPLFSSSSPSSHSNSNNNNNSSTFQGGSATPSHPLHHTRQRHHYHGNSASSAGGLFGGSWWSSSSASSLPPQFMMLVCIVIGILAFFTYNLGTVFYQMHLIGRVRTPLNEPRIIQSAGAPTSSSSSKTAAKDRIRAPELFWGSYRPQLYFGMKHRSAPHSLLAGLAWFRQEGVGAGRPPRIRYWCNADDQLAAYNWLAHDGRNFGVQEIVDEHAVLTTSFIKRRTGGADEAGALFGRDWTARVAVRPRTRADTHKLTSLLFYFYLPADLRGEIRPIFATENAQRQNEVGEQMLGLEGQTIDLGMFRVQFVLSSSTSSSSRSFSYLISHVTREDRIFSTIGNGMGIGQDNRIGLIGQASIQKSARENIWVFEVTDAPGNQVFTLDIVYTSSYSSSGESSAMPPLPPLHGNTYTLELQKWRQKFDEKFARTFNINRAKYSEEQISLAKRALSNLIGGMGYFHGRSLVKSEHSKPSDIPDEYWAASLFTATPSRPQFPRGFLWDEGFHQMLISRWDPDLTLESFAHWLDLINVDGWIPREQILGWEAHAKVPGEFLVQRSRHGNPPTFFMALEQLDAQLEAGALNPTQQQRFVEFLVRAQPRLKALFQWFNTTQLGSGLGVYQWQGRTAADPHKLNPLTLTSGLDDYPRASHPSAEERHLDLRCWMTAFARAIGRFDRRIATASATNSSSVGGGGGNGKQAHTDKHTHNTNNDKYSDWARILSNQRLLDETHWDGQHYSDFGLHTDAMELVRPKPRRPHAHVSQHSDEQQERVRQEVGGPPRLQFLSATFGYVSLFPLLLRVLEPNSARLGHMLDTLRRTDLLWTPHGLRSLAPSAALYQRFNSDRDPPYWRGAIWLNINWLAVHALAHYASEPGPHQQRALELHTELQRNLVRTVIGQFKRTGYLWEQYDDKSGAGQRAHPFSGWTALIVLIMSDDVATANPRVNAATTGGEANKK